MYHIIGFCRCGLTVPLDYVATGYTTPNWCFTCAKKMVKDIRASGNPQKIMRLEVRDDCKQPLPEYKNSIDLVVVSMDRPTWNEVNTETGEGGYTDHILYTEPVDCFENVVLTLTLPPSGNPYLTVRKEDDMAGVEIAMDMDRYEKLRDYFTPFLPRPIESTPDGKPADNNQVVGDEPPYVR